MPQFEVVPREYRLRALKAFLPAYDKLCVCVCVVILDEENAREGLWLGLL